MTEWYSNTYSDICYDTILKLTFLQIHYSIQIRVLGGILCDAFQKHPNPFLPKFLSYGDTYSLFTVPIELFCHGVPPPFMSLDALKWGFGKVILKYIKCRRFVHFKTKITSF